LNRVYEAAVIYVRVARGMLR